MTGYLHPALCEVSERVWHARRVAAVWRMVAGTAHPEFRSEGCDGLLSAILLCRLDEVRCRNSETKEKVCYYFVGGGSIRACNDCRSFAVFSAGAAV